MISVIIASYNARQTIADCLRSLAGEDLEIIVVDSSHDGTADLVERDFPQVRLVRSLTRLFPGDARNRGLEMACGDRIALLDADCEVDPDWVSRLRAIREPIAAGSIAPHASSDRVAWAAWFCKCTRWAPQAPAGVMADLPACSLTFERRVYDDCGPFLEGTYCSDTAFCWAARRRGYRLWFEPTLRVRHRYSPTFEDFLRRQGNHGRTFARVRRAHGPPHPARLLALTWPLLAPLLFARTLRAVVRHRVWGGRFVAVAPLVLAGFAAWAAGEGQGYAEA